MGTPDRSVAIRLGTTGKADVTQAFDEIASSGEGSARRFKVAYERAGEDVTAAIQRQASAAAKLAAIVPQTAMQMQVNAAAGSNTRFGGGYAASAGERNGLGEGSAKRSAAAFRDLIAAEEQLEARTRALVASIDPAFVAQQRFNAEIGEARALVSAGAISLDQYVAKLRIEQAALDGATNAQNRAANSAGAHRAAMQGLSFQAQDAFTQISMGTNPLSVLAIQGGQAAGQMANLEGKVGAVASFFIGPWGLAITGGLLLLGALTDKMMKASEAADKKKGVIKDLTKSINDLNEATSQQIKSEQAVQAETLRTAGTLRQKALDARTATIEQLKLARAALAQREATADPTNADGGIDVGTTAAERRTAKLSALLKVQEADLAKAQVTFRQAEIPAIQRRVSEAFDSSAAATGRYERAVDKLNEQYAKGKVSQASYEAQLSKLTATKERETEAAKKGGSVSTAAADADARVASATNDVQRATANLAKVRADSRAELKAGTITQAEYTARVADAQRAVYGARDAAKAHTAAVKDAAEAQRELASDLTEVVRRFDPTRAAAEQYAETLAKIAKLRGAGKLTDADAGIYAIRAGQEEAERAAKVRSDNIKKIFGINGDPLADVMSGYETEQQARIEALSEASERQQTEQEQGVRKLSSLYTSLFSSGTKTLWQEFEQRGKQVLADLLAKWTLGQMGNVNGGGLLGSIKKLFGAGTSLAGGITAPESIGLLTPAPTFGPVNLPKLASGTEYWSGGMALLGEGGVEAAYLPRGTRVSPASETRRAMGVGQVGHASVEIVPTKYFDAIVRHATAPAIADGMATAATQGAVGGAEMARTGAAKARSRSLVR